MKKLENIIRYYANSGVEAFTKYHDNSINWVDDNIAKEYLKKHSLSENEAGKLKTIQESVFYLNRQLPDMIFRKDFEFITLLGGAMFEEKDFEQFGNCLKNLDENTFAIFQDTFGLESNLKSNILRLKFPSNISWKELMSGNYISTVLFEPFYNHYYVFGESGEWGMYVANEGYKGDEKLAGEPAPIRIIGFNPKYQDVFRTIFKIPHGEYSENMDHISEEERPNLRKWVPEAYR